MAFISNGVTILDNGSFSANLGSMVLLSEQTASASASISFTSGIDSTYPIYRFEFINIHPATNGAEFQFQGSINNGSSYGVTMTTTFFQANLTESDSSFFGYNGGWDLAQSTSFKTLFNNLEADSDESLSGELQIFNPSSITFVKHFICRLQGVTSTDASQDNYSAGYYNTTSAVDAIRFQMSSGNIDSGTIKLYGIKDS